MHDGHARRGWVRHAPCLILLANVAAIASACLQARPQSLPINVCLFIYLFVLFVCLLCMPGGPHPSHAHLDEYAQNPNPTLAIVFALADPACEAHARRYLTQGIQGLHDLCTRHLTLPRATILIHVTTSRAHSNQLSSFRFSFSSNLPLADILSAILSARMRKNCHPKGLNEMNSSSVANWSAKICTNMRNIYEGKKTNTRVTRERTYHDVP